MKNNYKKIQVIEISIDELFCWQDKLDMIEDTPEKAWGLFNDFLNECENQLDLSDEIIDEINNIEKEENLKIITEDDLFEDNVNIEDSLQFRPRLNF